MARIQDDCRSTGDEAATVTDRLCLFDKKTARWLYLLIGAVSLFLSTLCIWERILLANTGLDPYRLDIVIGMYFFGLFGFIMVMRGLNRF